MHAKRETTESRGMSEDLGDFATGYGHNSIKKPVVKLERLALRGYGIDLSDLTL